MKNIHVIPTDKPSRLCIDNSCDELNYCDVEGLNSKHITNQHIYITNDEEIKEGDNCINLAHSQIVKPTDIEWANSNHHNLKKIILTTDQDLINDGVQAIDDEFLQWFIKNPSCKFVRTDLVPINEFGSEITVSAYGFDKFKYKIIIPQEEPKQEPTNEELLEALKEFRKAPLVFVPAERMYSEEGVPTELEPVLAKINHQNDLGLSQWYEVVYYADDKWCSYSGSKTFQNGEIVVGWVYCKNQFKKQIDEQ